jgi:hypothetical protein
MNFVQFATLIFPWFCLVSIILGTIGNIFVFVLYSKSNLAKTSFSIYFRAISITDTINLCKILTEEFILTQFKFDPESLWCPWSRYVDFTIRPMCEWIQVAVSLDRFVNIAYPRRFPIFERKIFQMAVTLALIAYSLIVYSPITWNCYLHKTVLAYNKVLGPNGTEIRIPLSVTNCNINKNFSPFLRQFHFYNSVIVPFILMTILSVMLIVTLVQTRLRVRQRSTNSTSNNSHNSVLNHRDRKFAITIIIINMIFLVMVVPNNVPVSYSAAKIVSNYLQWLSTSHSSTSFYIQLAVNSLFRREFFKLLRLFSTAHHNNRTATSRQPATGSGAEVSRVTTSNKAHK